MKSHRQILAWQRGIELVKHCYTIARALPSYERFELASQLRRASVSIVACIAEGHASGTRKEFAYRVSLVRQSTAEIDSHLVVVRAVGHVRPDDLRAAFSENVRVGQLLTRLHQALRDDPDARPPGPGADGRCFPIPDSRFPKTIPDSRLPEVS
jgi:four helix bundle protein